MNLYIYKINPGNYSKLIGVIKSKYIPRVEDHLTFMVRDVEYTGKVKYVCICYTNDVCEEPENREDVSHITIKVELV